MIPATNAGWVPSVRADNEATEFAHVESLTKKEIAALDAFRCKDTTRTSMCQVWTYVSDGGRTDVATDGHTIAVRRSGTHVNMLPYDIEKLPTIQSQETVKPVGWARVLRAPDADGKSLSWRGMNPAYLGRVSLVEAAETKRRADSLTRKTGETDKAFRIRKGLVSAETMWCIGCEPLDGWYWKILDLDEHVRWEGVIMPRRL